MRTVEHEIVDRFDTLIRPEVPIDAAATDVHGIEQQDVAGAPPGPTGTGSRDLPPPAPPRNPNNEGFEALPPRALRILDATRGNLEEWRPVPGPGASALPRRRAGAEAE